MYRYIHHMAHIGANTFSYNSIHIWKPMKTKIQPSVYKTCIKVVTVALLPPSGPAGRVLEDYSLISSPPASLKSVMTSTKWPSFSTQMSLWTLTPTEKRQIHCKSIDSSFSSWLLPGIYVFVYLNYMKSTWSCENYILKGVRSILRMWTFSAGDIGNIKSHKVKHWK